MGLKEIKTPDITFTFKGEVWHAKFELRNFAALKEKYNMSENEILQGLIKGETKKLPFAIWCASLVFAPFDPMNPTAIEKEISIEELFSLNMTELKTITDEVIRAMEAFLPKQNAVVKAGVAKKPTTTATAKKKNKKKNS